MKYLPLKDINNRYDAELREAVGRVLDSGWYLRGEATRRFEQHYAEYIGTRHCIGCGNGLDALKLILRAYMELGVMREGDEVIVPANTFIATILAITENRLVPVLVEPRLDTFQMDDALVEQAVTDRTRAVVIVHLYGICAYTPRVADVCRRHGLKLIEDNAQAHGCTFVEHGAVPQRPTQQPPRPAQLRHTGSLGDAAGHSFYPGKNLGALGDAGAVTTDDDELAATVRALGNYGSSTKYVHDLRGFNSRIDELQAAMLDVKLRHLDEDNQRRKEIAAIYMNKVENPLVRLPRVTNPGDAADVSRDSVWHIFPVLCERRDELQRFLLEHGVETAVHYPTPPHRQRCYAFPHSLPVTELIAAQELSLPCHPAMTQDEANLTASLICQFCHP
jgi:dTDP-4-amino-4,6-dideoxygalactose transaminase